GWNERGVATASTLFTRTIGQTVGAGLAGAILNLGLARYAPHSGDVLDLLLDAGRRAGLDAQLLARMVEAAARSLHGGYVAAGARVGVDQVGDSVPAAGAFERPRHEKGGRTGMEPVNAPAGIAEAATSAPELMARARQLNGFFSAEADAAEASGALTEATLAA